MTPTNLEIGKGVRILSIIFESVSTVSQQPQKIEAKMRWQPQLSDGLWYVSPRLYVLGHSPCGWSDRQSHWTSIKQPCVWIREHHWLNLGKVSNLTWQLDCTQIPPVDKSDFDRFGFINRTNCRCATSLVDSHCLGRIEDWQHVCRNPHCKCGLYDQVKKGNATSNSIIILFHIGLWPRPFTM